MRGSPLFRTLLVLIALILSGAGLSLLGKKKPVIAIEPAPAEQPTQKTTLPTPFTLTLSAPASKITLESAGKLLDLATDGQIVAGSLPLEPGHPTIFLTIQWTDPQPSPRFAKLTLEPPSLPTLNHVFDAAGEIDDVWELHLHD